MRSIMYMQTNLLFFYFQFKHMEQKSRRSNNKMPKPAQIKFEEGKIHLKVREADRKSRLIYLLN